ncbi:RUS family member 1 [Battus philenor]|uniref:RUS family member 1 n=1 Tax=Battus philenor TaxID=42288 RepID=UPI0035D0ACF7
MFYVSEGEIIFGEKYGSSPNERLYVKPMGQSNIVTLDNKNVNATNWITRIFLPHGYPESVSNDYLAYQIWDTAQAFCSTIAGTLATQEILRGVGVGDTTTTPLAATVTWVIKDGCGHVGRILFAFSHGTYLDAYSKKWRLYADTLNDAAMCIEIALPLFKNYTTFALCISSVMKAIVGVAGGATRTAMTQHHAVRGNMADVAAKDSAQETTVNLIASLAALVIIYCFGSSLFVFALMVVLHIVFNYFAVRAVSLKTLNETRYLQVINYYLKEELIAPPEVINKTEPIIFYQLGSNLLGLKLCGFKIIIGPPLKNIMKDKPKAFHFKNLSDIYYECNYILHHSIKDRKLYVLLKEKADSEDILCAYFHAVILAVAICAINDEMTPLYKDALNRPFGKIYNTIQFSEWSREPATDVKNSQSGFFHEPTYELLRYVNFIVNKSQWKKIITNLQKTGWDCSKHLLMVDEWRVRHTVLRPRNSRTMLNEPAADTNRI